jgi:hypothetical protein
MQTLEGATECLNAYAHFLEEPKTSQQLLFKGRRGIAQNAGW